MRMDVWWDGQGSPAAPALGTKGIRPPLCMSLPRFWEGVSTLPCLGHLEGAGGCRGVALLHPMPASVPASPGVPRWGAPKYSHVGNIGAGAKLPAHPRGRDLEEQVAQSIPRDKGMQHPDAASR